MRRQTYSVSTFIALALGVLFSPFERAADAQVYFTPRAVLAAFFPSSERVTYRRYEVSPELRRSLSQRLNTPITQSVYTFYIAQSGDKIDGYALIDDAPGQYMPITFAVQIAPAGALARLEIMTYREQYGSEVRDARFRQQFTGKTAATPLLPGQDVTVVSGATISSRALTLGVRRALLLFDALILHPPEKTPPQP